MVYETERLENKKNRLLSEYFSVNKWLVIITTNLVGLLSLGVIIFALVLAIGSFCKDFLFILLFWFYVYVLKIFQDPNSNSYGTICNFDLNCDYDLHLICKNGYCNCSSTYYFDGKKCGIHIINKFFLLLYSLKICFTVIKKTNDTNCNFNYECNDNLLCVDKICTCNSAQKYWNGTNCGRD